MAKKKAVDGIHLAPVDEYPERPYDEAKDEDANTPRPQQDQIADYREKHPTLKTDGPENDPDLVAELFAQAEVPPPAPETNAS